MPVAAGRKPLHLQTGASELAVKFITLLREPVAVFAARGKNINLESEDGNTVLDIINIDIYYIY